jgi:Zn-finger nucleic acid-binding protein
MPARSIAGIGINECPECNGIWAPGQRFDLLVAKAIEARQSADPAKLAELKPRVKGGNPARQRVMYRKCPVCETQMARSNFRKSSGVITDRCNEHGTWLDADELEQIAGFILSGECSGASNFRPRTAEDMQRTRAAAAFRREIASQDGPFRTPADQPLGISDPGGFLGSLFKFLTKTID